MRVIVKADGMKCPIPVLIPSILVFNHLTAIIMLVVMLILKAVKREKYPVPLSPWKCFWLFHRLIVQYWLCRVRMPGWKLVEVESKDARVTVKL